MLTEGSVMIVFRHYCVDRRVRDVRVLDMTMHIVRKKFDEDMLQLTISVEKRFRDIRVLNMAMRVM